MIKERKSYLRIREAIVGLQTLHRKKTVRKVYMLLKRAIIKIQSKVKGWLVCKQEKRRRVARASRLREDLVLLWEREYTPLVYRSKFFLLIEGNSYLYLALYEEEKKRLVESLGGAYRRLPFHTFEAIDHISLAPFNEDAQDTYSPSTPSPNPLILNSPQTVNIARNISEGKGQS
jgi:hypothetical protein